MSSEWGPSSEGFSSPSSGQPGGTSIKYDRPLSCHGNVGLPEALLLRTPGPKEVLLSLPIHRELILIFVVLLPQPYIFLEIKEVILFSCP